MSELKDLKLDELKELVKEKGIDFDAKATKTTLIELIEHVEDVEDVEDVDENDEEDTSPEINEKEYITLCKVNIRDLQDEIVRQVSKATVLKGFIQDNKLYLEDNTTVRLYGSSGQILFKEVE